MASNPKVLQSNVPVNIDPARPPTSTARTKKWISLIVAAVLVAAYSPSWLYLGYLAGATPKAQVQDIQLSLAPGWYPILTAESFLGRLILKEGRPRAVFFKAGWPMPWLKNEITVVKFSAGESAQLENGKGMITLSKEYPWGTVHFMQRAHLAYIAPFGVSVSSTYSFDKLQAAVDDIQRISRIHTSP